MITSTANPRVKALARLRQRSERDATGCFLAEGSRIVTRTLESGWGVAEVIVAPELLTAATKETIGAASAHGVPVLELGEAAFRKIAYRQHPDGVLAVVAAPSTDLDALALPEHPLLLVVEAIEKPGNLGAMLRTADGAGVDAVIAADPATDPFNPNVVRASQGSLFTVPMAVAAADAAAVWLGQRTVHCVAARPGGPSAPWQVDLTGSVAIVVGSEHIGLSPVWDGAEQIAIPMRGVADSLNASTAAAVLVYEALRQRS